MNGIYKITNLVNRKVYIGQSNKLNTRKSCHFYLLKNDKHHNDHLQRAYNKYGKDNFIFEVIEETNDLDNREIFWIDEYGGINSELNYNLKNPLTMEWSDYVKIKSSKIMSGENNYNFGKKWTQEQKDKQSIERKGISFEQMMGKEKADIAKENMRKGQLGRKHPDEVKEKISKANQGSNNPAYGMGDRQRGDKNPMWGKAAKTRKPVLQYSKEGEFIKEFEFLSQVKELGLNPSNVLYCATGKYKTCGGFIWKFKE